VPDHPREEGTRGLANIQHQVAARRRPKKYAHTEPLLLKGDAGMKQREKTIPPRSKVRFPKPSTG